MSAVPSEYEAAAREVATSYDVTNDEADVLASDARFAVAAYLRREAFDAVSVIRPTGDRDDLSQSEKEALRDVYAACGALTDTVEHTAETALGREIDALTFDELLAAVDGEGGRHE